MSAKYRESRHASRETVPGANIPDEIALVMMLIGLIILVISLSLVGWIGVGHTSSGVMTGLLWVMTGSLVRRHQEQELARRK
jgi:hypothetical protein